MKRKPSPHTPDPLDAFDRAIHCRHNLTAIAGLLQHTEQNESPESQMMTRTGTLLLDELGRLDHCLQALKPRA